MKLPFVKTAVLGAFALSVTSCNQIDMGVSDYRRSVTATGGNHVAELDGKYVVKDDKKGLPIDSGETISINLEHAFIRDYSEADVWYNLTDPKKLRKRGEIAVVVRVKEIDNKGTDFDFSSGGYKGGRLVYYSDSVHVNGHLNFSFLPVYGPIKYNGYPLAISVYVIELDGKASQGLKTLLGTLSAVGGKAYPPSSQILSLLDKIGTSLTSNQKDDVDLAYHFYLQPYSNSSDNKLAQPLLLTGNYALVKQDYVSSSEVRAGIPFGWNVKFDNANGTLLNEGAAGTAFLDATYLTFQINKGQKSDNLDEAERYATFSNFLEQNKGTDFAAANDLGNALLGMLTRDDVYKQARSRLADIQALMTPGGIPGLSSEDRQAKANTYLVELKRFLQATSADATHYLRSSDREALLQSLTALLDPTRKTPFSAEEIAGLATVPVR